MAIFPIGPFRKASVGNLPPLPFRDHLELWLDARILSGADASNVVTWPDQSKNRWDMPQGANFATKPTLRTTSSLAPTGQQTVQFQPRTDTTTTSGPYFRRATNTTPTPDFTLGATFYIWETVSYNSVSGLQSMMDMTGFGHKYLVTRNGATGWLFGQNAAFTQEWDADGLTFTGTLSVVSAPPSNGTGAETVFANGVQQALAVGTGLWPAPSAAGTLANLSISDHNAADVGSHPIHGQVGIILWYSIAHTASQRATIERWMRSIWG